MYQALSDIIAVVKDEDDRRPVITVVGEITKDKIDRLNRIVPWLDGLGINSYRRIKTLGNRVTEYGWKKPFFVTEYGPHGPWDAKKTVRSSRCASGTVDRKGTQASSTFDQITGLAWRSFQSQCG